MQAKLERVEVEPARRGDDDLAIDDGGVGQCLAEGVEDLREEALQRLPVAAADVDVRPITEHHSAEAVPLGLVAPARAVGDALGGARQHRLEGR